ncbi:MAG TPA: hypothetical protein VE758_00890, partial [Chthoniobacterales bacterium]|nr:hypothetical protein [Chthoniobacterales bacterium]
ECFVTREPFRDRYGNRNTPDNVDNRAVEALLNFKLSGVADAKNGGTHCASIDPLFVHRRACDQRLLAP